MKQLITAALLLSAYHAFGQSYFHATIADSISREVLTGATVVQQGTLRGTSSDVDGKVRLAVTTTGAITFEVAYIGYTTKTIIVSIPQQDSTLLVYLSPNSVELEEVTVTTVRTNSRIEDIPTPIEVLGLDEMNEENGVKPGNIVSLLGDIAGVQMQQVSASSGNTYARIQGLDRRYTQLLKDGMPLFGGLAGNFSLMSIPPLDLKQIEIIKGSASTLYGGDAIGGIINLVSKDPTEDPHLDITLNQSTLKETNVNGYYAKRFNSMGITVFAGQTLQSATDIDSDGLSDVAEVHSTVVHPKLIFYLSPDSRLTLNYTGTYDLRLGGDMQYVATPSDSLYHVQNKSWRHSMDAHWNYQRNAHQFYIAKVSTSLLDENLNTKHYTFSANQLILYSEFSYLHTSSASDWVGGLNVNGDFFNNKSDQLTEIPDYDYLTLGGFVQNTWRPTDDLIVESGFRLDYHSDHGTFPLPRLALMYRINQHFTTRVNGGFGYKIPTEITYVDPETDLLRLTRNPDLKSELSRGVNIDLNFHKLISDALSITINQALFYTTILRPVYDSGSASSDITLTNADAGIETQGLQTYARIEYRTFELYLGYVFTDIKKRYDIAQPRFAVTPKHNFSTTFFYEPSEQWRAGIESAFIAGQLDQDFAPVKNYLLLAVMVQYKIGKLAFVLNGENMLDFRQNTHERVYDGTIQDPQFHQLWAPIDGRVINLSVKLSL